MEKIILQIKKIETNKNIKIYYGDFNENLGLLYIDKNTFNNIKKQFKSFNNKIITEKKYYYQDMIECKNNHFKQEIYPFDLTNNNFRMFEYKFKKISDLKFPNIIKYDNVTNERIEVFFINDLNINFIQDIDKKTFKINISFEINNTNKHKIVNDIENIFNNILNAN